MTGTAIFRCQVTEAQAGSVRERIGKAGLDVGYQEEQHGVSLLLIMKCSIAQAHSVRDILAGVGVAASDDLSATD